MKDLTEEEKEKLRKEVMKPFFQILTKRPERMLACTLEIPIIQDNIWLGVSVENQKTANQRLPFVIQTPASVRWISIEPMLDFVGLDIWLQQWNGKFENYFIPKTTYDLLKNTKERIDWVVVGCESGNKRRECKLEWIESIVEQCKSAGVPVFVKQIQLDGKVIKDINLFPSHLRIREYPKGELK